MLTAAALTLLFSASVPCDAPPGTVVAVLKSGGNGNPITYQIIGGDSADFRVRGTVIVVGLNAIDPSHCGSTQSLTVTATQK